MRSERLRARMITELERAATLSSEVHLAAKNGAEIKVVIYQADYYAALDRARMWRVAAEEVERFFHDLQKNRDRG